MSRIVTIFYPEYIYRIGGEIRSEEDLLVKFLASWAQQTDLFIRDQQIVPKPSLWRYMENTDKLPFDYMKLIEEYGEPVEKVVCDYIAGMSDDFAIKKIQEIFVPARWSKY